MIVTKMVALIVSHREFKRVKLGRETISCVLGKTSRHLPEPSDSGAFDSIIFAFPAAGRHQTLRVSPVSYILLVLIVMPVFQLAGRPTNRIVCANGTVTLR